MSADNRGVIKIGQTTLPSLMHRRLGELLGDGRWHDLEPVIRDLSKLVPPGVAMRRNEKLRSMGKGRGTTPAPPQRKYPITPQAAIRSGARSLVQAVLNGNSRHGEGGAYTKRRLKDGTMQIRRVREPVQLKSDRMRAEHLRPAFNAMADHFHQLAMDYAREQVQFTAHEYGFHLSSCPPDCSLAWLTKRAEAEDVTPDEP